MAFRIVVFILTLVAGISNSYAANSGVTYQGRILKPDGSPLAGANTQFKMQIRTPDAGNCLMYEELQALDLRNTNGAFSLTINDGTGTRTDATGLGLDRIFANQGSFTFSPATCSSGGAYTPNNSDGRNLVVYFKDETMGAWEPIPAQKINFVPFAFEAKQVAGFSADSLLRVVNGSGDPLTGLAPLSNAQYTELIALVNGTSTRFSQLNGTTVPAMTSGEVLGWNGSAWVSQSVVGGANSVTTTMLQANAVDSSKIAAGAVGTSQIAANVSIATSGTVATALSTTRDFKIFAASPSTFFVEMMAPASLATSYTLTWPLNAGTAGQILTTDGSGGLSWSPASIGSQWTSQAPGINYMAGSVGIGTTSPATKLEIAGSVRVGDGGETCAAGLTGAIRYNGGNLQFCNGTPPWTSLGIAGSGISSLTGDVTATGPGAAASTVVQVSGYSAANVAAGATLANTATTGNTPSMIVKRDASGNFAAGAVTQKSSIFNDNGANTVTVQAPTTVTTSYVLKLPTSVASTNGQVLTSDTTGNLSWTTMSGAPTGAAGGDLGGTYPNPTVATVGTSTAASLHSAELASNAATALNTSLAIVKRDGTGNFAANVATVNGVALNNAGSLLNIVNPLGANYTLTLPTGPGTSGQVLSTNGSGVTSWLSPMTSSTGFINGGNAFGAVANLGLNDAFDLNIKTNAATRMTVTSAGNVGIGTTNPYTTLHVQGVTSLYNAASQLYSPSSGSVNTPQSNVNLRDGIAADNESSLIGWRLGNTALATQMAYFGAVAVPGAAVNAPAFVFGQSTGAASYSERVRIDPSGSVGIGTTSPAALLDVNGSIDIKGLNAIRYPATDSIAGGSIAIGASALNKQDSLSSTAFANIAIGYQALSSASLTTSAINHTAIGYQAMANVTSAANDTAIGYKAMGSGTGGQGGTAVGASALKSVGGDSNTGIGSSAGANLGGGYRNTAVGASALSGGSTSETVAIGASTAANVTGANNTVLGTRVGSTTLTNGTGNILIGNSVNVDTPASNTSNFLNIGNLIFANGMSGTLAAPGGNVGIGTTAPAVRLDVNGSAIFRGPTVGGLDGELYYDNISHSYQYYNAGATAWQPLGSGTINYTGTLWTQNGSDLGYTSGRVGIGTASPASTLHVVADNTSSKNYGVVSVGAGAFDGASAGKFVGSATGTELAVNASSGYAGNLVDLQVAGVSRFSVNNAGNVTVGGALTATGNLGGQNLNAYSFATNNGWNSNGHTVVNVTDAASYPMMAWQKSGVTADVIDINGNLGIGTTTPTFAALEVRSAVSNRGAFITGGAGNSGAAIGGTAGAAWINGFSTGGSDVPIIMQSNGVSNVAIGTSTSTNKFDVNGNAAIGYVGAAAPAGGLIVSGNVGVGTSTPQATLDINGVVRLKQNAGAPSACAAGNEGTLALTTKGTLCNCHSSNWVSVNDGTTACTW